MANSVRIVVSGASGTLGGAVVEALKDKGYDVVPGTTNPEKRRQVQGIYTRRLVFEDLDSVAAVLEGAAGLFLMAPPLDPESDQKLIPAIDRAKEAGVGHIVFNSALGADMAEELPLHRIEKYLASSGVNHTVLRPNFFMENFSVGFLAPMLAQGGIFLAAGDGKTSFISVKDIAAVAAMAFEKEKFGQAFNLTGPEALDHTQVATLITNGIQKTIQYHAISEAEMVEGALNTGMPEGPVQMMAGLYAAVRQGFMASVTEDVKAVTGQDPIRFEDFVQSNKSVWV